MLQALVFNSTQSQKLCVASSPNIINLASTTNKQKMQDYILCKKVPKNLFFFFFFFFSILYIFINVPLHREKQNILKFSSAQGLGDAVAVMVF